MLDSAMSQAMVDKIERMEFDLEARDKVSCFFLDVGRSFHC